MPRTKQQTPRHIVEEKSNEEGVIGVEEMPTAIDFSPSESPQSQQGSDVSPENEALEIEIPSPAIRITTPTSSDDTCRNRDDETPAGCKSVHRSGTEENDSDADEGFNDSEKTSHSPFVNVHHEFPWKGHESSVEKGERENNRRFDCAEFLKTVISHNMSNTNDTDRKNGVKNIRPSDNGRNGGIDRNNPQWAAMLQNMVMANPIQLMAKYAMLYESHKKNQHINNTQNGKLERHENVQRKSSNPNSPDATTLNALRNRILDRRNSATDGRKELYDGGNSSEEKDRLSPAESEKDQSSDEALKGPKHQGKMFRPFLPDQESFSERRKIAEDHANKNRKLEIPSHLEMLNKLKSSHPQFPSMPWVGLPSLLVPPTSNNFLKHRLSPKDYVSRISRSPDEQSDKKSSPSPVVSDVARKSSPGILDLAISSNSAVESSKAHQKLQNGNPETLPNRYKSPSPHWTAQRHFSSGTPYQRYMSNAQRNSRTRSPEKYPVPFGYSPISVAPHGPFPLSLAPLSDFPPIAPPPYYNPWGMIYPPLHPGMDGMPPNPLLHTLHAQHIAKGGSPPGHLSTRPSSNPGYHSAVPGGRKPNSSRGKVEPASPIDAYHAAIVREAKEMNKGMDPENMYIECPICHKKIKRLYHFQRHMRIHSGEKSHSCPFCPYKSVRKDNLKSHMKTHEKSKYDASRRVQNQRRESAFPSRPEFQLSANKRVADSPPVSTARSPIERVPFLALGPNHGGVHPAASPPMHAHRASNDQLLDFSVPKHPSLRDMPFLPPTAYFPNGKAGFPYNGYPVIPPFIRLPSRDRQESQTSPGCITEIEDKRRSPSSESKPEERKGIDKLENRCTTPLKRQQSDESDSGEVKRYKIDPPNMEEKLLLGNANNSNNFETKPLQIFSPSAKSDHTVENSPKFTFTAQPSAETKPSIYREESPRNFRRYDTICRSEKGSEDVTKALFQGNTSRQNGGFQEKCYHLATALGIPSFSAEKTEKDFGEKENEREETNFQDSDEDRMKHKSPVPDSLLHVAEERRVPRVESNENSTEKPTVSRNSDQKIDFVENSNILSLERHDSDVESNTGKCDTDDVKPRMTSPSDGTFRMGTGATWMNSQKESKCRLCGFVATTNSSLQEHMTCHKEDGMYKCELCDYHGKNLSKLEEHIRIHTGERPYQCDQCSYAAKRKDNLAQHKRVRHDKNRFKSPVRVLKLSAQNEYEAPQSIPPNEGASLRRNSEYRSIVMENAELSHELEKRPQFPCSEWFAKFGEGRLPAPTGEERLSEEDREKRIALPTKDSPNLFNPHAYPFFSYNNMTSSFMYGHPLMASSVFSSLPTLPVGENPINGVGLSSRFSTSPPATGPVKSKPCFSNALQECAR